MKAEPRVLRRTDALARHHAKQQRACRKTASVDDNILTGGPYCGISLQIAADLTTAIFRDPHCCGC